MHTSMHISMSMSVHSVPNQLPTPMGLSTAELADARAKETEAWPDGLAAQLTAPSFRDRLQAIDTLCQHYRERWCNGADQGLAEAEALAALVVGWTADANVMVTSAGLQLARTQLSSWHRGGTSVSALVRVAPSIAPP